MHQYTLWSTHESYYEWVNFLLIKNGCTRGTDIWKKNHLFAIPIRIGFCKIVGIAQEKQASKQTSERFPLFESLYKQINLDKGYICPIANSKNKPKEQ